MNIHLNEKQITDATLGLAEEPALRHLERCQECRSQVEATVALVTGFSRHARREAERDDLFWARQESAILERTSQNEHATSRRAMRFAWRMTAAATFAALLVLWVSLGSRDRNLPVPPENPVIASEHESDELLLRQVEAALERRTPVALAPAEVLTRELHRRTRPEANIKPVSSTKN
jgi:hypothetical protein